MPTREMVHSASACLSSHPHEIIICTTLPVPHNVDPYTRLVVVIALADACEEYILFVDLPG